MVEFCKRDWIVRSNRVPLAGQSVRSVRPVFTLDPFWGGGGGLQLTFRLFLTKHQLRQLHWSPATLVASSFSNDATPTFQFAQSDPDLDNSLRYQIQVATNADFPL